MSLTAVVFARIFAGLSPLILIQVNSIGIHVDVNLGSEAIAIYRLFFVFSE